MPSSPLVRGDLPVPTRGASRRWLSVGVVASVTLALLSVLPPVTAVGLVIGVAGVAVTGVTRNRLREAKPDSDGRGRRSLTSVETFFLGTTLGGLVYLSVLIAGPGVVRGDIMLFPFLGLAVLTVSLVGLGAVYLVALVRYVRRRARN